VEQLQRSEVRNVSKKTQQSVSTPATSSPKEEVEAVHKQNLQYILTGDIKGIAEAYSSSYLDLGGGPTGDGKVQLDEAYWSKVFLSGKLQAIQIKTTEELVNISSTTILSYSEMTTSKNYLSLLEVDPNKNRVGFIPHDGDILIIYPPQKGSPLYDGFWGIYRKEGGRWKIVASD